MKAETLPSTTSATFETRRTRWIVAALVLLVAANAFLLPLISLGHYQRTISDGLSRSLGHTVQLGSANLAVFPLPGVVIHDLIVEEDPAFGAEPLLRAPSVTVFLRISSLWRQHLEISRINIDGASVNLAREPSGRWNFSSLLLQASRTATAPTAQRRASAAPRFPYIEFSAARINFKFGAEKKAFSFLNANASVWLADPDQWRIRFEAQPARTDRDLELADTGTIHLEGSLTRASSLDQLPLDLHAEWTGAQLGQVSRLVLGSDSGWRGDLRVETGITGDMRNLTLRSRLHVDNAHRIEFTPIDQLNIDTRCDATYRHPEQSLDNLTCLWPTGDGHLLLTGDIANFANPQPHLNLEINHTPVAFAVTILSLLRSTFPSTLDASGTINGNFTFTRSQARSTTRFATRSQTGPDQTNILTGHAVADNVALRIPGSDDPLTFAALRFDAGQANDAAGPALHNSVRNREPIPATGKRRRVEGKSLGREAGVPGTRDFRVLGWQARAPGRPVLLVLEPASFSAGAPAPMQVSGQFSRSGFTLHFTGEAAFARLQPIARNLAQLHALSSVAPQGIAQSDLTFSGPWIPAIDPETGNTIPTPLQGWTHLQHAELTPAWLPEPIEITSATAQFANGYVTWANAAISVNGTEATGSAAYPLTCDNPAGCPAQINLNFRALDAAAFQSALLGNDQHGEFVQAILSTVESPMPPWPALNATIHAGTFTIGNLALNNATAAVSISNNRLNILSLDANTLGGSAHAAGFIRKSSDGPQYSLNIIGTGIKLTDAASLFHEKWGTGSVDGQLNLNLHGYSDLAASATGEFRWIVTGSWAGNVSGNPSGNVAGNPPGNTSANSSENSTAASLLNASEDLTSAHAKSAHPSQWSASGTVSNGALVLTKGPVQGTISFDRSLDLHLAPEQAIPPSTPTENAPSAQPQPAPATLRITGTLADPVVAQFPESATKLPDSHE